MPKTAPQNPYFRTSSLQKVYTTGEKYNHYWNSKGDDKVTNMIHLIMVEPLYELVESL